MFVCLIAAYVLVFVACAMRARTREGFWGPVTIFGIGAFYYYLSVPLELFLRGEEVFTTSPGSFGVAPATGVTIAWCALLALLGFVVGHHASGLGRCIQQAEPGAAPRLPHSLRLLGVVVFAAFVVLYRSRIFEKLAYSDANEFRYTDPVFSYLTRLTVLLACLGAGVTMHRRGLRRTPAIVMAGLAVAWGLHSSDKNPLLKAALGGSALWIGRRSQSLRYLGLLTGAAVLTIAALPVFSNYRANLPLGIGAAIRDFSVLHTDAKGPMISLVVAVEEETERFYGRSYLFSLVAWVPRTLWPDRPNDLAHEFALDEIPNWEPGSGLGYSLLAEAYLNFGPAGAFAQYFVLAFALGRIWATLYNLVARSGAAAYWRAMLAVTYFDILIIMHRAPSSSILQSCIFELLIPVTAFCMLDRRRRRTAETSLRATTSRSESLQSALPRRSLLPHGSTSGYRTDARPLGA
jgi:hypothetical protein